METAEQLSKGASGAMMMTKAYSGQKMAEVQDNLSIFINNIVVYCKLLENKKVDGEGAAELLELLRGQLNELWFEDRLKKISDELDIESDRGEPQPFEKKLYQLEQIIRAVAEQKNAASTEEKYINYESQTNHYIHKLESILQSENIKQAIEAYELYDSSRQNMEMEDIEVQEEVDIPSSHFFKELINTKISYGPNVFNFVRPVNHQFYLTEAAKTYCQVAPFKIKNIALSITEGPVINRPNFFNEDLDQSKAILGVCLPGTKKFGMYSLADLCKVYTVGKEFYQERQLGNDWEFSKCTRSVITPSGKIYAINCRTTSEKIDHYFYEISESKASNRGPLPVPRKDSALIYLNNYIYMIGGQGEGEKCSRKSYRYSLKEKKWTQICESNVALRKPTVCSMNNRYICKLGGLNEFDYINKVIEMYDTLTDRWSLVRASPRNILEEIQILEDSYAIQINDDQIYVFGGKNANKFNTDSGFVLLIAEIREKKKGAAKVSGQFWNVSVGKRNILTFFGQFYASSVIIHHNVIYGLRMDVSQALSV